MIPIVLGGSGKGVWSSPWWWHLASRLFSFLFLPDNIMRALTARVRGQWVRQCHFVFVLRLNPNPQHPYTVHSKIDIHILMEFPNFKYVCFHSTSMPNLEVSLIWHYGVPSLFICCSSLLYRSIPSILLNPGMNNNHIEQIITIMQQW